MKQPTRRIIRETRESIFERGRNRAMMLEYDPRLGVIRTWPKGTRRRYPVSLAAVWQRAVKAEVLAAQKKRRKEKR